MGTAVLPWWACRPPAQSGGTVQESLPSEKKGGVFRVVSATTCFAVPAAGPLALAPARVPARPLLHFTTRSLRSPTAGTELYYHYQRRQHGITETEWIVLFAYLESDAILCRELHGMCSWH